MTNFLRTGLLMFLTLFFFISTTLAQTNLLNANDLSDVNIDNYSNEEIASLYQKAVASGIEESQLYSILQQRGLSQSEISKLRLRIQSITRTKGVADNRDYSDTTRVQRSRFDTATGRIPIKLLEPNSQVFGSELFSSNSLAFEPNLRIPPPPNYMLGPDDQLVISIYGFSEKKYDLRVNELGEIYIPNVGPILVSGLTLEQATAKIKNKLASTIYTAIRSGQTKVQVTLGKIRSIRVTVIGQAKKPGTFTVSSLTTLYNILYLCGGPTDMGSYRNIEVIRGKEKRKADLYDFLVYGNQRDNILLQEGDVIRIPYYSNRVSITGNVKREGKFEMLDGEKFSNLLHYCGGFTDVAFRGAVSVSRITDSVRKIIDLPSSQFASFITKGSDTYHISKLQEEYGNRVYVTGSVQRPGPYELTSGLSVGELIAKSGGTTSDAYLQSALIYRYLPNKLPAIESVNLDSILNLGQKVYLQKNDSLVINSIFYYRDKNLVTVEGKVRNPGQISWRKNLSLNDVLFEAGGITDAGDSSRIEISRRINNAKVEDANHMESKIINVNLANDGGRDILLSPFDVIIVKEKPGYTNQRVVIVNGEVISPGKYALEKSGSTIKDIISRTGGFKASADSNSITIRRFNNSALTPEERQNIFQRILNISSDSLDDNPKLRNELYNSYVLISVNLRNALENPESSDNLTLEDGDILTISRTSNLVKVSGEVYSPTLVAYKPKMNLRYYVEQAGNFMPRARKAGAFVIYPNGKTKSVKQYLFFRSYPEVIPRSEIFVPQKDRSNRNKMGATEWAVVVSALAIAGNVIVNLTK